MSEQDTYSNKYQRDAVVECYEQEIYKPGGHDEVIWRVEQRGLRRLLAKHVPDHSRADAMDFACGTGRVTGFMRSLVGSLVGVDISPAMLEVARPKVGDTPLIRADIVNQPDDVPGGKDLITAFRFLLLAEPPLREAVVRQLATKLRDERSVLIFSLHGNPCSYRAIAALRNKLITRGRPPLPGFGLGAMRRLAETCGLRIVDATGLGYVPHSLSKRMPVRIFEGIERALAGRPLLWRFGSNLLVVCRRA